MKIVFVLACAAMLWPALPAAAEDATDITDQMPQIQHGRMVNDLPAPNPEPAFPKAEIDLGGGAVARPGLPLPAQPGEARIGGQVDIPF